MKICRVNSFKNFNNLRGRLDREYSEIEKTEKELSANRRKDFFVPAFSYSAGKSAELYVHKRPGADLIDWRESLVCPETSLNNRLRAAHQFFDMEFGADREAVIYLSEQTTAFYKFMKARYVNLIGSEYLDPLMSGGTISDNNIRNEDLTNLSFEEESIDYCVSLECFEHIPLYKKGFSSCYRVLKPGGKLMISVPFILHNEWNTIRAQVNEENQIIHLLEPEYHQDPIDPGGCLCFTNFGWQILDELRSAGFSDTYALLYWSREFGYLGGHQILIVAIK